MNQKLIKMVVKGALGFGVSALIGYTMKAERKIEERIDKHFDEKTEQQDN